MLQSLCYKIFSVPLKSHAKKNPASRNSNKNKAAGQKIAADDFQLAHGCLLHRRSFKELGSTLGES